jgi:hypothetical protein
MIYRITAGADSYSAIEFFLSGEEQDLESLWNEMMSGLELERFDDRWDGKAKQRWHTGRTNALKALYYRLTGEGLVGYNYLATKTFVAYLKSKGFTTVPIADYEREH